MTRFVVCGETLIDLVQAEAAGSDSFSSTWLALSAGGPMNSAVALGKLGDDTHFLGRLSKDAFGRQLRQHILEANVKLDLATESSQATSIAVVSLDERGRRQLHLPLPRHGQLRLADRRPAGAVQGRLAAHRLAVLRGQPGRRGAAGLDARGPGRGLLRHQRPADGDHRSGGVLEQGAALAAGGRAAWRHRQGQRRGHQVPGQGGRQWRGRGW